MTPEERSRLEALAKDWHEMADGEINPDNMFGWQAFDQCAGQLTAALADVPPEPAPPACRASPCRMPNTCELLERLLATRKITGAALHPQHAIGYEAEEFIRSWLALKDAVAATRQEGEQT